MAEEEDEKTGSSKVFVTLPRGARDLFDQLVDREIYGSKNSEVARHIIINKLDELVERGRLVEVPPKRGQSS